MPFSDCHFMCIFIYRQLSRDVRPLRVTLRPLVSLSRTLFTLNTVILRQIEGSDRRARNESENGKDNRVTDKLHCGNIVAVYCYDTRSIFIFVIRTWVISTWSRVVSDCGTGIKSSTLRNRFHCYRSIIIHGVERGRSDSCR